MIEKELVLLLQRLGILCLVFREIFLQTETERLKNDLARRYDWSLAAAFNAIDVYQDGIISPESINSFLRINGFAS